MNSNKVICFKRFKANTLSFWQIFGLIYVVSFCETTYIIQHNYVIQRLLQEIFKYLNFITYKLANVHTLSDFLLCNKILCLYQGLNNIECEKTLMWCSSLKLLLSHDSYIKHALDFFHEHHLLFVSHTTSNKNYRKTYIQN